MIWIFLFKISVVFAVWWVLWHVYPRTSVHPEQLSPRTFAPLNNYWRIANGQAGLSGAKWGQAGPNGAKWCQSGSNGAKKGLREPNGAKKARRGQTRSNGVVWGWIFACTHIFMRWKIMFSSPGPPTKIGWAMGIMLIPRFWWDSTNYDVVFLVWIFFISSERLFE